MPDILASCSIRSWVTRFRTFATRRAGMTNRGRAATARRVSRQSMAIIVTRMNTTETTLETMETKVPVMAD